MGKYLNKFKMGIKKADNKLRDMSRDEFSEFDEDREFKENNFNDDDDYKKIKLF